MLYEDLPQELKADAAIAVAELDAYLRTLNPDDHPREFNAVVLYKDDKVFGTCVFHTEEDYKLFLEAYTTLEQYGKWGRVCVSLINPKGA